MTPTPRTTAATFPEAISKDPVVPASVAAALETELEMIYCRTAVNLPMKTKAKKTRRPTNKMVRDVLTREDRAHSKLSHWEIQGRIQAGVDAQPTYGR